MHIVTGMHRSGTSFLAQALSRLGVDFGPADRLFPADFWNQNGYFESIEVVDINNQLILGRGTPIDLWLKAPENGMQRALNSFKSRKWKYLFRPSVAAACGRAAGFEKEIVSAHATYEGLSVKDPRFCLTLGAWAERGPVEGVIFSFRNPWAVATSIQRREKLPLRMGYQQWLYHIRGFWSQVAQDTPVFLVDFDQFFEAGTQAAAFDRLIRHVGHDDVAARRAVLVEALDLRLRHHKQIADPMPEAITHAYEGLLSLYAACDDTGICARDHPQALRAILQGAPLQ
ncbi:MAG: hypothetical protein AAF891_05560 [Pseudomonadota bacterium]